MMGDGLVRRGAGWRSPGPDVLPVPVVLRRVHAEGVPCREALLRGWLLAMALTTILFTAAPRLDLAVSALFWDGAAFPLAASPVLSWVRFRLWDASVVLVVVALVGFGIAWATGRPGLWLPARVWGFVLALYALGPWLLVDAGFKSYWGRARPSQIAEFGGAQAYSPPLWPAAECARNCSFVSGEAAAGAALGISVAVIAATLRSRLGEVLFARALVLALALPLVAGVLRLAVGRHFLSDVIFAWALVFGVALALDRLILRPVPWRRGRGLVLTPPPIPPIGRATRRGSAPAVALD